jgi:TRAP-type uncharacterized transport system substrate-binding protein
MARLWIALAAVLAGLLVAAGVWVHIHPAPSIRIIMATGPEHSAYNKFGEDYAKALKLKLVDVRVLPTRGSVDNLALLTEPKPGNNARADAIRELTRRRLINTDDAAMLQDPKTSVVALVQGGVIKAGNASGLESLGAVFYEPLWLFRRRNVENAPGHQPHDFHTVRTTAKACRRSRHGIFRPAAPPPPYEGINGLRGLTIAAGPNGSGTQLLACELLRRHGITWKVSNIEATETMDGAVQALLAGTIDALFIVSSWDAPNVQKMLADERIELVGYPQADAYADYYAYLSKVRLHPGAIDFAGNKPPREVPLIAPKASLIVHADLPLPVQYLLLNAMKQIHGQRSVLQAAGEFPAAEAAVPPLSVAAQQFYKQSAAYTVNSFLMAYLPFSVAEQIAEQIDNVIAALLLITTLSFVGALLRLLPILYNWVRQRPVFRLLLDVLALEAELRGRRDNVETMARRLEGLEKRANRLIHRGVPTSLASLPLILRLHLNDLHEKLQRQPGAGAG